MGGKLHPRLNTIGIPIAYKYRKGKVKRTLKRESKVLETVKIHGMITVGFERHLIHCLGSIRKIVVWGFL